MPPFFDRRARILIVLLLVSSTFADRANAQRLPTNVIPSHYDVTFAPDLQAATFSGTEEIQVRVTAPTATVVLNALDLQISEAVAVQAASSQPATIALDHDNQQASLSFPQPLQAGEARIRIKFSGILNEQLAGLYLSKTPRRRYTVTQFESTDARRAFPCFDEPALKATFDVATVVDTGDMAISNSPVASDVPGPGAGKHTVRFATTKRMSTYLVALLVGDFECLSDSVDGIPLRVCGVAGQRELGRYALEATKAILTFYNRYYSIRFPFEKLDQIAVPDFMAGAMENAGAIVYRDTELLLDERTAGPNERRGVADIIAHEVAHQWFGDLVTMDWWNNVWLNEGFATWMSSKPLAAWKPEWDMALGDVKGTVYALSGDAVASTRAIQAQQASTPGEINQLFDGVTYGKTAAVLRMVEQYIGPETFRAGVNAYLEQHAYGNATAEDFWTALKEASGKPVDQIMASFVKQPGAPLLSVTTTCAGQRRNVSITQQRFFSDPALLAAGTPERWTIPVCFKSPGQSTRCEVISQKQQTVGLEGCASWTMANAEGRGYYRTEYGDGGDKAIARAGAVDLTAAERIVLLSDEWGLVALDHQTIPGYLDMVAALGVERSEPVTEVAWRPLEGVGEEIVADQDRPRYQAWVRRLLAPQLAALGRDVRPGDSDAVRKLRARVLAQLAIVGHDPDTIAFLKRLADAYLIDETAVDPSLVDTALGSSTKFGDAEFYDRVLKALGSATGPDRRSRLEYGLAAFAAPPLIERTLQRLLTPEVRNQDLLLLVFTALHGRDTRPMVWAFIKKHFDEIQARLGSLAESAIVNVVNAFCDPELRDDARAFFNAHPLEGAEVTLAQGFERADACIRVVGSQRGKLSSWLAEDATLSGRTRR